MNNGASGSSLRWRLRTAMRLSSWSSLTSASGLSRSRRSSLALRTVEGEATGLCPYQHARPTGHRSDAPDREVGAASEEVGALVATLERGTVEVLDRLVDGDLPVAVLDDHPPVDHVDLAHAIEVESPLVPELSEHQSFVVEALRAEKGDGQDDRVDAVRSGPAGPAARLHRPDSLDLARSADDGETRLGRQVVLAQVELGERHGLVVEAPGGSR